MNDTSRTRVIIADDDHEQQALLRSILERDGYEVVAVDDGEALLTLLRRTRFLGEFDSVGLVVVDLVMPRCTGWRALEAMRREGLEVPTIVASGEASTTTRARARALGVSEVLAKPASPDELRRAARDAMAHGPPNRLASSALSAAE